LDDGIHIIVTNFLSYKQGLRSDEPDSYRAKNDPIVYTNSSPAYDYHNQSNSLPHDEITPPVLTLSDKLPLSMLLCLLADGRQLTLEEIDRVLVYLLEKKAKMLTLPPGTLPPLPAQYATVTTFNHQTGTYRFASLFFVCTDIERLAVGSLRSDRSNHEFRRKRLLDRLPTNVSFFCY
jgi:hypothetical protein